MIRSITMTPSPPPGYYPLRGESVGQLDDLGSDQLDRVDGGQVDTPAMARHDERGRVRRRHHDATVVKHDGELPVMTFSITARPSPSSSPGRAHHGDVAQVAREDRCFGLDTSTSTTSKESRHAGTHSSLGGPVDRRCDPAGRGV
jgi:hypothetical protein